MANGITNVNMSDQPQQTCPLMRLPAELRLVIFELSLQRDVDTVFSTAQTHSSGQLCRMLHVPPKNESPYYGTLALLHTSRLLRIEALDALEPLATAHKDALAAEWKPRYEYELAKHFGSLGPSDDDDPALEFYCNRYSGMFTGMLLPKRFLTFRVAELGVDDILAVLAYSKDAENHGGAGLDGGS